MVETDPQDGDTIGLIDLDIARTAYYEYSGQLSAVPRQLAFAGIALVWVFKTTSKSGAPVIPGDMHLAAILIVVGLGCDLLHYLGATISWGWYQRHKEKEILRRGLAPNTEFSAPNRINYAGNSFLILKVACILTAYSFLLRALGRRLL